MPSVASQCGEADRGGAVGGQAGDAENGDRGLVVLVQVADVALDEGGLPDVREGQVLGCGQDPEGAAFETSMAAFGPLARDRGVLPGQGIQRGDEFRLVSLTQRKKSVPRWRR